MSSRSRKRKRTHRTGETGASGSETDASGDPLETPVTDIGMAETPGDRERLEPDATAALKVKISATADVGTTLERLQQVTGLRDIEPLFPGETQPELAKIYVAHVDADHMDEVIPEVEADEDVEYVDKPVVRKLV
jgi:hypothetical protein